MTITHDPELPWAVINPGNDKVVARFEEKGEAEQFLNTTYGYTLKNTSPAPTEAGVYAINGAGVRNSRHFLLTTNGGWFWLDFTAERGQEVLEATTEDVVARYNNLTPKWVEA